MKNRICEVRQMLLSNYSRAFTDLQVGLIENRRELFEDYWHFYTELMEPLSRRAAWVITHAVMRMPDLITTGHLQEMMSLVPEMKHDGEKRTAARILSLIDLPDELLGEVTDLCFRWLNDTGESIAVRAYCMDTLQAICKTIPELKGELAASIENHMDRFSAGLTNKGAKVLKSIRKVDAGRSRR